MTRLIDADALSEKLCETTIFIKDGEVFQRMINDAPSADRPKNMIHIDDVYRLIAGHSNYHGDSILSAFTCLVEGKDVKPIAPLDESADRPTGEWKEKIIKGDSVWTQHRYYCSVCGGWNTYGKSDYCPNCGAKMRGAE